MHSLYTKITYHYNLLYFFYSFATLEHRDNYTNNNNKRKEKSVCDMIKLNKEQQQQLQAYH